MPADVLWDGYRQRLEAERDAEAITYSLWVDWFEDHTTSATAFTEVLGNDADTRHLAELRHVLTAGHKNHYRSPGAWDDAVRSCS
ncbi:hypothetical protein [Streptomyces sp. NPDC014685]|uniref:hypothetical protein n=1 Tax=Streptomyces sp. NPDC014685 TaxID=3364881 RepID=UPI0036F91830